MKVLSLSLLLFCVGAPSSTQGQDTRVKLDELNRIEGANRVWESKSKSKIKAELVSIKGEKITLKKENDQLISINLNQLSEADQNLVKWRTFSPDAIYISGIFKSEIPLFTHNKLVYRKEFNEPYSGKVYFLSYNGKRADDPKPWVKFLEGQYDKGIITGIWTSWNKDGIKKSECIIGKNSTTHTLWHDNGIIHSKGQEIGIRCTAPSAGERGKNWEPLKDPNRSFIQRTASAKTGDWKTWYKSGKKRSLTRYFYDQASGRSVVNGEVYLWHENGKQRQVENYRNGKLEGAASIWHGNGQLRSKVTFRNGIVDGSVPIYFEDGKKQCDFKYSKGIPIGKWIEVHPNGKKKMELDFRRTSVGAKQSSSITSCYFWWDNGQLESKRIFSSTGVLEEREFFERNGDKVLKGAENQTGLFYLVPHAMKTLGGFGIHADFFWDGTR